MGNVHRLDRKAPNPMKNPPAPRQAVAISAGLSVLFLVVYGSCIAITGFRAHVGTFYFQWERSIPFVPFLIPAYLSLDLFFIGAPFLYATTNELRTYSKRIAAAILIAGIVFLLFPLHFAFARPHADGIVGLVFDRFRSVDAPYNLFPSLHAALLLLVADVYVRHVGGVARIVSIIWFVLIGLSPVLTYQHHVIDIVGGMVLALGCFYFLPERTERLPVVGNVRIGTYYIVGASLLLGLAIFMRGWGAVILWPALAVGIVGTSYFGVGPAVYRKTNGRLRWSARILLLPCLLGQHLSLYYYRRRCRAWDLVTPEVWIGGRLSGRQARKAVKLGVTSVLDLTAEFSEARPFRGVSYRNLQVLDLTAPTQEQLLEIAQLIGAQTRGGIVYVHCKIGYSRSAAAVAAYLLYSGKANHAAEAFGMIRQVRPSIIIRPEVMAALTRFERELSVCTNPEQIFVLASPDQVLA